ncbi:MAG TPA: 50S ribosomal protein L17 [Bacteroidales bacterium]|nr:50S ribosomal protein L17 [Bacteroidales bacterium]HOU96614.1 50S ribosomal protein L17 [Bacteroidales bacterium]HQG35827.1 50S ribosomal protein L17 [Bacteroidales bacterium]HQG53297.1 50S ribosomal protein L17 [Bacteroidales bacterium]HQJ21234.1 50S ribosomal protein L17 [Bacteroidales bacterium]
MRHQRVVNHLGRTSSHRKAMLSKLATSLIMHKRIRTTTAKAKALRTYVEPLITKSKEDSTHSRRVVFRYLQNKQAVSELFREISPKIADRPGGYTRILKTGNRIGDNAEMCFIELVDFNETMLASETKSKTTGRRRRSTRKKSPSEKPLVVTEEASVSPSTETKIAEKEETKENETSRPEQAQDKASQEEKKEPENI